MLGHNNCNIKLVPLAVIMAAAREGDVACIGGQNPTEFCHKRDEMRCEVLLQMWQISAIELHSKILSRVRQEIAQENKRRYRSIPRLGIRKTCVGAGLCRADALVRPAERSDACSSLHHSCSCLVADPSIARPTRNPQRMRPEIPNPMQL